MGVGLKKRIVLSGVNCTEMGPLAVFKDALASLAATRSDRYEIIALVHKKSLFDTPGVTFMEFPAIKSSWLKRLRFEYHDCRGISEQIKPHLWFSMHDMTPNVQSEIRAVYCHNASPFYPFCIKEALLDWRFGLFTLLYRFLYAIHIKQNHAVIVQQDWMRSAFRARYGVRNIVVSHPSVDHLAIPSAPQSPDAGRPYRFFYPAHPRTFKNMELILDAARTLERNGFDAFEIGLTMNGTETTYAAKILRKYSDLATVRWLGVQPRTRILSLYVEADCLLFPSKLESWGMPITEFKATGKPVLVADLPYAHETVGTYDKAAFFDVDHVEGLAAMMRKAVLGEQVFHPAEQKPIAAPFARNWNALWEILLSPAE